ncbi:Heat shock protein Hsp90 family [Carpediemonas membranifera]|uniref:Heat shock protein Hsp90 family n=1 Tax=Carpediemonas membranifera TaxID=201153 RepID=A0A8J6B7Q1_9EUKA|nr:Heat shock protein Hsp90 family [Carpediemonas membranifera]|eukprot:KAG9391752.1 Heat shock protein Hsp90 family [Carpediemonas membranifera]
MNGKSLCVLAIVISLLSVAFCEEASEKHEFQAEVSSLMNILVHSLYSEKEVFLRELLSNAADALDKLHYLSLTEPEKVEKGELAIHIDIDTANNRLVIEDNGIGMTRDELSHALGTIAESGTKRFIQSLRDKEVGASANDLIGQFGVGFYSAFLAAHTVTVETVSYTESEASCHTWESVADTGSYTIAHTPDCGIERGTRITLHLRDDAREYATEYRVKMLVGTYSEFLAFPIYLSTDGKPYDRLNTKPVLWRRQPSDITDEEYNQFFKDTVKDSRQQDPLNWMHFTGEGDVTFSSLVYIPSEAPIHIKEEDKAPSLKVYAKRVFIGADMNGLLPQWASFVRGIIDCDDIDLNVSREMVQGSRQVRAIGRKIVFNLLNRLNKMAQAVDAALIGLEEGEEPQDQDFYTFYFHFAKNLKLGVIQDEARRPKLLNLLRYPSTHAPVARDIIDGRSMVSFEDYVARAPEGQKSIYYAAGENLDALRRSPFLERLTALGVEVLFLTDSLDEYVVQNLRMYTDEDGNNWHFSNVAKEAVDLSFLEEAPTHTLPEGLVALVSNYLLDLLENRKVERVAVSQRLTDSAAVVVSPGLALSANQQRIMRSQTMNDVRMMSIFENMKRVLEINVDHPVVTNLAYKTALLFTEATEGMNDEEKADALRHPLSVVRDETLLAEADVLYETAMVQSGFPIEDAMRYSNSVYQLLGQNLVYQVRDKVDGMADIDAALLETMAIIEEQDKADEEEEVVDEDIIVGDDEFEEVYEEADLAHDEL